MSLSSSLAHSFERSFTLYHDLIDSLDEGALASRLPGVPSNSVGLQLWCVIGARESFCQAIRANHWEGFSCSLETPTHKASVVATLRSSAEEVKDVLKTIDAYTDIQNRLIVDLLEHEAAHHGQLIRYLFALNLTIPDSWKSKYGLG